MPISLQQLPLHILASILQFAINPEEGQHYPQISVIRVCSAFYLAAMPHIYRISHVENKIHTFFSHRALKPPVNLDGLHSAELARSGLTKLAALRYVHRLKMVIPEPYTAAEDDDLQMTDIQKAQIEQDGVLALESELDSVEASLRALPVGFMPMIESLQIGSMSRIFDHAPATRAADLAALLLYRVAPRVWCQYHGRITPLAFPVFQLAESRTDYRLPTLYRHTRPNYPFSILPGSTTFLYIHRHPPPLRNGRPVPWRTADSPESLGRWIGLEIRDTFHLLRDGLDARTQGIIDETRVIIGGTVEIFPRWMDPDEIIEETPAAELAEEREKELRDAEEVAGFARAALIAGSQKHLKNVKIEVRTKKEMPPCPACGMKL